MDGLDTETRQLLKSNQVDKPLESKARHLCDDETEQEEADMLERVMADLDEFKKMTEE